LFLFLRVICTYTTSAVFGWVSQYLCQILRFQSQYTAMSMNTNTEDFSPMNDSKHGQRNMSQKNERQISLLKVNPPTSRESTVVDSNVNICTMKQTIDVRWWGQPKKLYTIEGRPSSKLVHPVVGEGLGTLTDFVQNIWRE
jgi:hypothetical protein